MMQFNSHISSMIHYSIRHIRELYRLSGKVASTNAKENLCMNENLRRRIKMIQRVFIAFGSKADIGCILSRVCKLINVKELLKE